MCGEGAAASVEAVIPGFALTSLSPNRTINYGHSQARQTPSKAAPGSCASLSAPTGHWHLAKLTTGPIAPFSLSCLQTLTPPTLLGLPILLTAAGQMDQWVPEVP